MQDLNRMWTNDIFIDIRFNNMSLILSQIGGIFFFVYLFFIFILGLFSYRCFISSFATNEIQRSKNKVADDYDVHMSILT